MFNLERTQQRVGAIRDSNGGGMSSARTEVVGVQAPRGNSIRGPRTSEDPDALRASRDVSFGSGATGTSKTVTYRL